MRFIRRLSATLGLALTIVPSVLFFAGSMPDDQLKTVMLIGAVLWFIAVIPKWNRT
jgi:hypothetical protein